MASHFFPARLRNFRGEAGHRANNALAERFRGELRYEASKTDGRCLEPVYRRSKSLSVRRVISRNPFCAALSRSNLPRKGRRNEKPTRERCNFLTVLDSSLLPSFSLSLSSFRYCFFTLGVLQRRSVPRFSWHCLWSRWSRVCAIDWHGNSISLWKLDELRV